jgi:hypothetical protein
VLLQHFAVIPSVSYATNDSIIVCPNVWPTFVVAISYSFLSYQSVDVLGAFHWAEPAVDFSSRCSFSKRWAFWQIVQRTRILQYTSHLYASIHRPRAMYHKPCFENPISDTGELKYASDIQKQTWPSSNARVIFDSLLSSQPILDHLTNLLGLHTRQVRHPSDNPQHNTMVQPDHPRISGKSDSKGLTLEEFSALFHIKFVAYRQNRLRARFHLFDSENSGEISCNELWHCLLDLNSLLTITELDEMLENCDTNHDGIIMYEKFVALRSVPRFSIVLCGGICPVILVACTPDVLIDLRSVVDSTKPETTQAGVIASHAYSTRPPHGL